MAKALKIILSVFAAIISLLVITALILPLIIKPNDFKPQIAAAVKAQTGRELTIDGDIELSVFPWLGVRAKHLVLSNAEGFAAAAFAEIQNADIKAKFLPVFFKRFEVDRIVLDGLILNLEVDQKGITNWTDFGPRQTPPAAEPLPGPTAVESDTKTLQTAAGLAIAGISLNNARLNWNDRQSGTHFAVKDIDLASGNLAFNAPVEMSLNFTLELPEQNLTGDYKLSSQWQVNENLDRIQVQRFELHSQIQGAKLPGGSLTARMTSLADLNLTEQTARLNNLIIESGPLAVTATINGTEIIDNPTFTGPISLASFNPTALFKQLAIEPPSMQDSTALTTISAELQLRASGRAVDLQDIVIRLDDSSLTGTFRIDDPSHPKMTFELAIDTLNADRYLPPRKDSSPSAQPIAGPAAAVAAGASLIPAETLRNLNLEGLLSIGTLTAKSVSMDGITLELIAKNGKIQTQQTVQQLYRGSYNGAMNLDVTGESPHWRLNEKLDGIQLEPFLTDLNASSRVAGRLSATANLEAIGNTRETLKSTLNGQIDFALTDSIVRGINLQQLIDEAKSLIEDKPILRDNPKDQTAFSEIKGSALIANGLIHNHDLIATASRIHATGSGTADLNSERIDYQIHAEIVQAKSADKTKAIPVFIDIGGTFQQPEYRLDVAEMLKAQQIDKLERKKDKLLDKLDKKLGPGASDLLKKFF
ncbi:MAG: AsmA family protein [Methylomicrobium sp.]